MPPSGDTPIGFERKGRGSGGTRTEDVEELRAPLARARSVASVHRSYPGAIARRVRGLHCITMDRGGRGGLGSTRRIAETEAGALRCSPALDSLRQRIPEDRAEPASTVFVTGLDRRGLG